MEEDLNPWMKEEVIQHCLLLSESFFRWTKKKLIEGEHDPVQNTFLIYHSDAVIVSHGIESDPVFNFANLKAQELWKLSWDEFIKTPSRHTVEPLEREDREKLLKEANEKGYISNYTGVRISSKGEKFLIRDVILWNLVDNAGIYKGQAAVFSDWEFFP